MIFSYTDDGRRESFDPRLTSERIAGCLLCGRPVVMVGVLRPIDDVMRQAVITLRQHPMRDGSDVGISYGLCAKHSVAPDTERVERVILAAAARVVVQ